MTEAAKFRVLLVEDDEKLANLMKDYLLSKAEFSISIEPRGDRAVERILEECPDLVVLDIMLPGMDGLTICRTVRPRYGGPILMLTALSDEVDEVVGLEIGADDYLAKPVSPRLLLARIKTLLRRAKKQDSEKQTTPASLAKRQKRIAVGNLVVDRTTRQVTLAQREVRLTTAEFDLLFLLAAHAGDVLTREQISVALRGIEWDGLDRSIDLRIVRLRKKLGDDAKQPTLIKSVRGAGYLLALAP
jgi:two-component system response regulator RstA